MLSRLAAEVVAAKRIAFWRGVARLMIVVILAVLIGLAVAGAFVFAGVGLYFSLLETMPPWQAGVVVGGAALLVALLLLAVAALPVAGYGPRRSRGAARHASEEQRATRPASDDGAARLGQAVGDIIARADIRATDMVLGALVAGVVLGASPRLRRRRRGRRNRRATSSDR